MYKYIFSILLLVSSGYGYSGATADAEPFMGEISPSQLLSEFTGFAESYQAYKPSEQELLAVQKLEGKSLLVLFGTWCHDSEREVPRLIKLLDESQVVLKSLSLRALSYSKQDTDGLHKTYQVKYTPTIILLDKNQELGRIIEYPKVNLGEDLATFMIR